MTRFFGYQQDAPDPRDYSFRARLAGAVPDGPLSLMPWRQRRRYQLNASACVGFALFRAIHVSLLAAGHSSAPEPAPAYLYANARFGEWAGEDPKKVPPLEDVGCYPRIAMQAVRELGFCRESDWHYDTAKINQRPKLRAYHRAYDQKGLQFYRIDSSGSERIADVRRALSLRAPVLFGMPVDGAFTQHTGEGSIDSLDLTDIVGGHAMTVLGHDPDRGVLVDNWWHDWGNGEGMGWISDDLFGAPILGDVYAITAAPIYTEAA